MAQLHRKDRVFDSRALPNFCILGVYSLFGTYHPTFHRRVLHYRVLNACSVSFASVALSICDSSYFSPGFSQDP